MMRVPLLDLRRGGSDLDQELSLAFERVLKSGRYILGPEVEAFEAEAAASVGASHAVGVSSGTDALLVSLMALGVGPGDEVICPTYTFFATAGSVHRVGARPVFVDSLPGSLNLDPADVERKLSRRTRAIIAVHLFGQCAEMGPIVELARSADLWVLEDAAQALGAEYQGLRAGVLGDLACFSFFPSKNLGGLGDGGLVTTNSAKLAERLRVLRRHGSNTEREYEVVGGNFRLDELQAALLRVKLRYLEPSIAARQSRAALYQERFMAKGLLASPPASTATVPALRLPVVEQARHVFNQYVIRTRPGRRDGAQAHLAAAGIGTEIYYRKPLHLQPCFASLGYEKGQFPVAEEAAESALALPIFPELTSDEVNAVARALTEYLQSSGE
jgi:dTDP-4-amino-4,6-dideoxygalactose transaminase